MHADAHALMLSLVPRPLISVDISAANIKPLKLLRGDFFTTHVLLGLKARIQLLNTYI